MHQNKITAAAAKRQMAREREIQAVEKNYNGNNRAFLTAVILSTAAGLAFVAGDFAEKQNQPAMSAMAGQKINPNTASAWSLTVLEGIGPVKAENIVSYRRKAGPDAFKDANDLLNVSGIGPKTVEKIKNSLKF